MEKLFVNFFDNIMKILGLCKLYLIYLIEIMKFFSYSIIIFESYGIPALFI